MKAGLSLPVGFDLSGLTPSGLWLHYQSIGGTADAWDVEAVALGLFRPSSHEYTVVAQALNEHFLDRGEDHPVAYEPAGTTQPR